MAAATNNLESLDNQTLVLCYTLNLLRSYEKNFKKREKDIEEFLGKIMREVIDKSSGAIFKRIIGLVFSKIENYEALEFLKVLAE